MSKANTRVPGHGLLYEGAPHNESGSRIGSYYGGVSGWGYGKCSCGQMSDAPLHSGGQRKEWHRDHKAEITNKESK